MNHGCTAISRKHEPLRSLQEHEIPYQVGRKICGWCQQISASSAAPSRSLTEGGDRARRASRRASGSLNRSRFERGVTHDPEFEAWANLIYNTDGDAAISLEKFRKDIIIELLNERRSRQGLQDLSMLGE